MAVITGLLVGCGGPTDQAPLKLEEPPMQKTDQRNVIANNAFFYYADLGAAWRFYGEVIELETVADYGFAKIMRIAETSYLTLVDAGSGIHSADKPKTVALALVTDELDGWYKYLLTQDVTMKSTSYSPKEGSAHDGFVAVDPEGYLLEFERFNHHPENAQLMPILDGLNSIYPAADATEGRPLGLGIKATVLWLYTNDLEAMSEFYGNVMGFPLTVDQGWARIHASSPSGFIGPVDGAKGMHPWTKDKAVMLSFLTTDIDAWFSHMKQQPSFEFREEAIVDEDRAGARVFVGFDPDGYYLEFDEFYHAPGNELLLASLATNS
jgi:predicted enzyme related to lactoylglutathione lyase